MIRSIWNLWLNDNYQLISSYCLKYAVRNNHLPKDIVRIIKKDYLMSIIGYIYFNKSIFMYGIKYNPTSNFMIDGGLSEYKFEDLRITGSESSQYLGNSLKIDLVRIDSKQLLSFIFSIDLDENGEVFYELLKYKLKDI